MKKIFSLIVIVAAVAMVSCCGNKKAATEVEATEVEATEVVEEAACCEKCDSCCEKCEAAEATEEVVEEAAAETVEEAK